MSTGTGTGTPITGSTAVAEVDIVNLAFSMIGEAAISSGEWDLGASGVYPRTRLAYGLFALTRDSLIRSYYWNCCSKYAEIMEDTTAPLHTYGKQYSLPSDFLRMNFVYPREQQIDYKIIGSKLLCDVSSGPDGYRFGTYYPAGKYISCGSVTYLVDTAFTASDWTTDLASYMTSQGGDYDVLDISYIYQNTVVGTWDTLFTEMFATKLAIRLCLSLAADKEIWTRLTEHYTKDLKPQARTIDAQDDTPDDIITSSWLNEMG
jgi:hypothetical protein